MHTSHYAMYRMRNCDLRRETLRLQILHGLFVAGSYRLLHEAGNPWDEEDVYEGMAGPPRRAITRCKSP